MSSLGTLCVKTISGLSTRVPVETGMSVRELKSRAVLSLGGSTKPANLDRVSLCFMSRTLEDVKLVQDVLGTEFSADDGKFLVLLGFKRLKAKAPHAEVGTLPEILHVWNDVMS